jgi:phosphoglycolate phosphatase-like HAD superfamily hydrolase
MNEETTLSNLVIFDLDGVITSEEAYWDTAGLVLHELLYSPLYWNVGAANRAYHPVQSAEESRRVSRETLPESLIVGLKARAVNSNWDTCYAGFCLYLIELLTLVPERASLFPLRPEDAGWITAFRQQLAHVDPARVSAVGLQPLDASALQGYRGIELLQRLNVLASEVLGEQVDDVFARYSPSWKFCQRLFQEWYLGEQLYTQEYGHPPAQPGKPGCILFEQPLLPLEQIRTSLEALQAQGYTLGVATGRPGQEAILPLKNYGLLHYFAEEHIVTDAEVARAEARMREQGTPMLLVKPHPFPFLAAADRTYEPGQPLPPRGSFVVVGDTTSDVQGAHAAGALVVAVLTGARTAEARAMLEQSQPDFTVADMTGVPAIMEHADDLATIQRLQFTERYKAELLLQRWFALHMNLQTDSVTLTPKPVSLNSFNGIYRLGTEEYFFKTHVEEQGVLEEYYNAELLHKAGYNVVLPLRTVHEKGQQMVIYPVIRWPVMFDLMREVETGNTEHATVEVLAAAEKRECERLLHIYQTGLAASSAAEHAQAPIHQLFWHRLTGGRLNHFYAGKSVLLPGTTDTWVSFDEIKRSRWRINGVMQHFTLDELIERAKRVLDPAQAAMTVVGHGDAHFGNVFLEQQQDYLYFDPAFAGRHSPLLDIVKPLFHNVFASWMYFPYAIEPECPLEVAIQQQEQIIDIRYPFQLPAVREAILQTKEQYLLKPLLSWLDSLGALPENWLDVLQSALLCCPLLTVNLFDHQRMPALISWLGLTYAVHMGNNGVTSWKIGENL